MPNDRNNTKKVVFTKLAILEGVKGPELFKAYDKVTDLDFMKMYGEKTGKFSE